MLTPLGKTLAIVFAIVTVCGLGMIVGINLNYRQSPPVSPVPVVTIMGTPVTCPQIPHPLCVNGTDCC
jgi:hypothetical protein